MSPANRGAVTFDRVGFQPDVPRGCGNTLRVDAESLLKRF
ncbi:hypothetical protein RISK_002904 [Rhodopirellula islandica]|uniref:Uncharacterized protein n=1 Tax=Rhodopirellula islandica TaxID=595434 RepID=A0A0J1BEW8_RHOIS|nr:hypothetical protein RISK_002904 [Rhodopirellula islandica]